MIERGEREASEAILFALERVLGKATGPDLECADQP